MAMRDDQRMTRRNRKAIRNHDPGIIGVENAFGRQGTKRTGLAHRTVAFVFLARESPG